jgi:hypothetical protein
VGVVEQTVAKDKVCLYKEKPLFPLQTRTSPKTSKSRVLTTV